jgi:hypothetical protein
MDLSQIRQLIHNAHQQRKDLLNQLMSSRPYIAAQVYERYKTCGNKHCKCQMGELHGPFLWIYQHKKGQKVLSTTVDTSKAEDAKKKAQQYKDWLQNRKLLRELDQSVQQYLDEMEQLLEKEAAAYVTKRSPGRPKKDR